MEYKRIKYNFIIMNSLFIFIMITMGSHLLNRLENYVAHHSQEELLSLSTKVTTSLRDHLNLKIKELTFLADIISERISDGGELDFDSLNYSLDSDVFNDLYLIKPDGSSRSMSGLYANNNQQDYFKYAIQGQTYISNPTISNFDGEEVIVYAVPIIHEDNVIGILCARNKLEELGSFLSANVYNERTNFYLVSHEGSLVATTDVAPSYLKDYFINHPFSENHNQSLHTRTYEVENFEVMNDQGKVRYITYQRINKFSNWFLVSAPNEENIALWVNLGQKITFILMVIFSAIIILINYHISKMKKNNLKKIEQFAFKDQVTGLLNQNGLIMRADKFLKKKKDSRHLVVVFDIEGFKLINEIYGYKKGDELLKGIATGLKQCFKHQALCARLSNENFGLILRVNEENEISTLVSQIEEILNVACYRCIEKHTNTNIGIYICPSQKLDLKLAIDHADMARLHVSSLDSQNYYVFDEELWESTKNLMLIQQEMKQALENQEFQVFYQSKFNPKLNQAACAEALVRWIHPEKGFISPATFIPIAEKSGDIVLIGRYVFKEVCQMIRNREKKNLPNIPISVNLSRVELYQPDLIDFLKDTLGAYRINPSLFEIEITETTALNDITVINEKIKLIHDLGITVSMDDFGTGSSTFSNLKHVDIDVLKIDRSFLWDIEKNIKSREIVHGIIDLAKRISVSVVCEGVECFEQVEILKEMGCDLIQGYVYARPIPRAEFEKTI